MKIEQLKEKLTNAEIPDDSAAISEFRDKLDDSTHTLKNINDENDALIREKAKLESKLSMACKMSQNEVEELKKN